MERLVVTADEMRRCDASTIQKGTSAATLMERVAGCVVSYMLAHTDLFSTERIGVLCGSGNNGGDGFAIARRLHNQGYNVTACFVGSPDEDGHPDVSRMSVDCAVQYRSALEADVSICTLSDSLLEERNMTVWIDAVFGIGLCRPIEGALAQLFDAINHSNVPVLAVDIPSGIHADSGHVLGTALKATATVTVQALKLGLLFNEGMTYAGRLSVCDVGIDLAEAENTAIRLTDPSVVARVLPPRARQSHKGTYGRLLLACGSKGMAGAAVLSTSAALRCGVGLADVLTAEENRVVLHTALPEAIVSPYTDKSDYDVQLARAMASCDAVVAGCGLGTSDIAYHALSKLLDSLMDHFPLVLDADALNLLAIHPELWETSALKTASASVVVTPHPYEMARLIQGSVLDVLENPVDVARQFAATHGVTTVLKGAYTVIASPDGQTWINLYGNAGMATGGSGDVLAGVIGALITQNREKLWSGKLALHEIAAAGVTLHAMAADLAAQDVGEYGLCASDMVAALPRITRAFSDTRTQVEYIEYK